jgi:methylmalonyl-CoA/ethylmalonyl-CoA epimerase
MRRVWVFVVGLVVGGSLVSIGAQNTAPYPTLKVNHVGIAVKDLNEAVKFYGEKLGFREVIRNPNGQSAYLQVSRETFIELQQANAERPAGTVTHWGLETDNIKNAVAALRSRGVMVSEPGAPSAFSGGILANVNDPTYGRIELTEQPADGKLRKASESWRQP